MERFCLHFGVQPLVSEVRVAFFGPHLRRPLRSFGPTAWKAGPARSAEKVRSRGRSVRPCPGFWRKPLAGVLAGAPRWPSGEGRGLRSEVGWDGLGCRRARLLKHILSLPLLVCFSLLLLLLQAIL